MIKAVIFDLDDTLLDNDILTEIGHQQAVKAMIENGLDCSEEQALDKLREIVKENPQLDRFSKLVDIFGPSDNGLEEIGYQTYITAEFDEAIPVQDSKEVLEQLKNKVKLVLITQGNETQQNRKIDKLGIRNYFQHIFIPLVGEKEKSFSEISEMLRLNSEEILVIGDRIDVEIKIGNKLGMKTARLIRGKYSSLVPMGNLEKPDYSINNLNEIINIIDNLKKNLKIVAIGGGTGLPTIVEGLRKYTDNLTMIVTVTDSGRSSGMLRKELDVLPPGDIRNCLIALSNSDKLMCDLFQYRFENGTLNGHSFGNLFIAALTKLTGSFEKAIEETGRILKLKGKVLPSTLDDVHVCVELEDGNIIKEENNIIDRNNQYVHLRPRIKRVFLKPNARVNEKVLNEIKMADLIVLCPGSLYTSVITNLLVEGVADVFRKSSGKKVYVCNIMTQVSQTHGFKASEHVQQIINYLGGSLDYVILNSGKPSEKLLESYRRENAFLVENDISAVEDLGVKVIVEDLLDAVDEKKLLWEKKDLLRHNPSKVAGVLVGLV